MGARGRKRGWRCCTSGTFPTACTAPAVSARSRPVRACVSSSSTPCAMSSTDAASRYPTTTRSRAISTVLPRDGGGPRPESPADGLGRSRQQSCEGFIAPPALGPRRTAHSQRDDPSHIRPLVDGWSLRHGNELRRFTRGRENRGPVAGRDGQDPRDGRPSKIHGHATYGARRSGLSGGGARPHGLGGTRRWVCSHHSSGLPGRPTRRSSPPWRWMMRRTVSTLRLAARERRDSDAVGSAW
jgi:hypothetical protein